MVTCGTAAKKSPLTSVKLLTGRLELQTSVMTLSVMNVLIHGGFIFVKICDVITNVKVCEPKQELKSRTTQKIETVVGARRVLISVQYPALITHP